MEVSYDGARRWVLVRATGVLAIDDVLRLIGSARAARMLLYEARCAERGVRVIRAFREQADAERWLAIVSAARYFRNTP